MIAMGKTIESLEARLREQDGVVAALTQRLEQAAEQLDRFQRTQGEPVSHIEPASADSRQAQAGTIDDMSRILQQWDAAQPQATLERIECSLEQLHALVQEQSPGHELTQDQAPESSRCVEPEAGPDGSEANPDSEAETSQPDSLANWEQLKAQLFGEQPAAETPTHNQTPDSSNAGPPMTPQSKLEVVEAPPEIDFDTCDQQALHSAISHRDRYTAFLIRKLRITELHPGQFPDWSQLSDVPEDLRSRIDDLRKTLDEHLRLAEVELALERARLSREATRLHTLKLRWNQQMEDQANSENAAQLDTGGQQSASARRWLRFLGPR